MTKRPKKQPVQPPALGVPVAPPLPFPAQQVMGQLEQRQITKLKVATSEYTLDDGTVLRVKPIIVDVKRATDQFGVDGKPLYILTMTNITETSSPPRLMKSGTVTPRKARK